MDIFQASKKLMELDLSDISKGLLVDVHWIRASYMDSDFCVTRHAHSSYEIHYIKNGKTKVILDDKEYIANPTTLYINRPKEYHEQRSVDSMSCLEYALHFSINLKDEANDAEKTLFKALNSLSQKSYEAAREINIFEQIFKVANDEKIGFDIEIRQLINWLIISTIQTISGLSAKQADYYIEKTNKDQRFLRIKQFLEDNISQNIPIDEIAAQLFISQRQLSRIINQEVGLSTKKYINELKLKKAKKLLAKTDMPQQKISDMLGFSSVYYFNQFFHREEGYPPGVYRDNTKQA